MDRSTLKKSEISDIIKGMNKTYKGHPMFNVDIVFDGEGKELFVFEMQGAGVMKFAPDQDGIYQLVSVEGKHLQVLGLALYYHAKEYAGKEWQAGFA